MRLHVIGEAPSRKGDGRPFSGASGRRLAALLGITTEQGRGDYESMWRQPNLRLDNLFPIPMPKEQTGRGDQFDRKMAIYNARFLVREWIDEDLHEPVICCGHRVYRAMVGQRGLFYKGRRREGIDFWLMPHPSGTSPYWNDSGNVAKASRFLKRIETRYGIVIDR